MVPTSNRFGSNAVCSLVHIDNLCFEPGLTQTISISAPVVFNKSVSSFDFELGCLWFGFSSVYGNCALNRFDSKSGYQYPWVWALGSLSNLIFSQASFEKKYGSVLLLAALALRLDLPRNYFISNQIIFEAKYGLVRFSRLLSV